MKNEDAIRAQYRQITTALIREGLTITTMESCTAGLIASLLTDTEGSSAILKGAFVTYSNEAKILQGVDEAVIDRYGVYSPETAAAMAKACKCAYGADIAVGITGTMGNADPANGDSIPGQIHYAVIFGDHTVSRSRSIPLCGSRYEEKLAAAGMVAEALTKMLDQKFCDLAK